MKKNEELSMVEVFSHFNLSDDSKGLKLKTYNALKRSGVFQVVGDFNGRTIYDLTSRIKHFDYAMWAIVVIAVEHYGARVVIPDVDNTTSARDSRTIRKINNLIYEYSRKIEFVD